MLQETHRNDEPAIQNSITYLNSTEAQESLTTDAYWPKWNSPWWHMTALFEMGHAERIPKTAVHAMLQAVKKQAPYFFNREMPEGVFPIKTPCHCSLGTIFQILTATGIDVDAELPWARPWFLRYQMPDGGLNCDEDAYQAHPPASSIVGTIVPLEAILYCTNRPFTEAEIQFLDRGAACLLERELRLGCSAEQNLEEKEDEADWLKPCFPRFYFYDVLRGLSFILNWAHRRKKSIKPEQILHVVRHLTEAFPDGKIRVQRHAFEGVATRYLDSNGTWQRKPDASRFPLLNQVSALGEVSPYLTRRWRECVQLGNL